MKPGFLIASLVCFLIANALFIPAKSFDGKYLFLICGAALWPSFLYMLTEWCLPETWSPTWRRLYKLLAVGVMGGFYLLGITVPHDFSKTVGPWVMGMTFLGVLFGEASLSLVEGHGVAELFQGVCLAAVYESGEITSLLKLYCLCIMLCTRRDLLLWLAGRNSQPIPLDLLDMLEIRLNSVGNRLTAVRESGQVTELSGASGEITELLVEIAKAKRRRQ